MRNEEKLPILTVTDAPSAHAEALIEEGLAQFNAENAGYRDARALAVLVSDPDSKAVVITINFQAPEFYQRHGYRIIFGQVDCLPGGARIFLSKDLVWEGSFLDGTLRTREAGHQGRLAPARTAPRRPFFLTSGCLYSLRHPQGRLWR